MMNRSSQRCPDHRLQRSVWQRQGQPGYGTRGSCSRGVTAPQGDLDTYLQVSLLGPPEPTMMTSWPNPCADPAASQSHCRKQRCTGCPPVGGDTPPTPPRTACSTHPEGKQVLNGHNAGCRQLARPPSRSAVPSNAATTNAHGVTASTRRCWTRVTTIAVGPPPPPATPTHLRRADRGAYHASVSHHH